MVKQKKRTCVTQSGKNYPINCAIQGVRLIRKQKIWLAICKFLWSLTNQNAWFVSSFCTELTLFCTVFEKNCTALNQSKWRNFFMYIIIVVIMFLKIVLASWLLEGEGTLKSLDSVLTFWILMLCALSLCDGPVLLPTQRINLSSKNYHTWWTDPDCCLPFGKLLTPTFHYKYLLCLSIDKNATLFNSFWGWEMTPSFV